MKAVVLSGPGGPEVLQIRDIATPEPGPGEVLVRVHASAINRADLLQRRGLHPAPPGCPADIPGLEFAGEVHRCGPGVEGLAPGRRVMGILGGGGQAEFVSVPGALCMPVPDRLDWAAAAAIPEAFLTAHDALFARGALRPGENVILTAAGSGVGTAALQLARNSEARTIATSRTASKRSRLAELGADALIDDAAEDWRDRVMDAAGARGVDVVLDLLGGDRLSRHLEVLASRGRIVVVGLLAGRHATLDLARLLGKRARIEGTVLRSRPLQERIALTREFCRTWLPAFENGELRAVIDRTYPLDDIVRAHAALEDNATFGKVVVTVP